MFTEEFVNFIISYILLTKSLFLLIKSEVEDETNIQPFPQLLLMILRLLILI